MTLNQRNFISTCITLLLLLPGTGQSNELSFVIPPEYENEYGEDGNDPNWSYGSGYAWQTLMDPSSFDMVPTTHQTMTSIAWRPDESYVRGPVTRTWDFTLRMGTYQRDLFTIDSSFAENLKYVEGLTTVHEGPLTFETDGVREPGKPHEFDYVIPFQNPLHYNPDDGPLFFEFRVKPFQDNGVDVRGFDPNAVGVSSASTNATHGEVVIGGRGGLGKFTFAMTGILGDFNGNGVLDAEDIDLLRGGGTGTAVDLTGDGVINDDDRDYWVHEVAKTHYGDANLDGLFNSTDFVHVFLAGEYEDMLVGNSSWDTGDWNGDLEFTSSDFVTAFIDLGYETASQPAAVPEPAAFVLLISSLIGLGVFGRFRR